MANTSVKLDRVAVPERLRVTGARPGVNEVQQATDFALRDIAAAFRAMLSAVKELQGLVGTGGGTSFSTTVGGKDYDAEIAALKIKVAIAQAEAELARTEKILLPRLDEGGATDPGQLLGWDGEEWGPVVFAIDVSGWGILDVDGELLVDVDFEVLEQPGVETESNSIIIYRHVQSTPAQVWTISHAVGKFPINVVTTDASEREIFGRVESPDEATTLVKWGWPRAGTAVLLFEPSTA